MLEKTFSVVVPTFGRPAFLEEAIASVLAQTDDDFECIIVDDASPEPVTWSADPRVRVVRRAQNGGPPAARNTGVEHAAGRYVAFLDDDDVWCPQRLEYARAGHQRAPVAICWQSTLGAVDAAPHGRVLEGDVSASILDAMIPHLGATSVERTVLPRFDERYEAADDVEWWLRLAQIAPVATTPDVGLLFRNHDGPRGRTGPEKRLRNSEMLFAEHEEWFRSHPRAKAFRLKRMGLVALSIGDRRLARRCFATSLRLRPEPRTARHLVRTFT